MVDPARFNIAPTPNKRRFGLMSLACFVGSIGACATVRPVGLDVGALLLLTSMLLGFIGALIPSQQQLARQELRRRIATFDEEVRQAPATREAHHQLLRRITDLGLHEDEVASSVARIRQFLEACDVVEDVRAGLSPIPADPKIVGSDHCFYHRNVVQLRRGGGLDPVELFLTDKRLIALGPTFNTTPWGRVARLSIANGGLTVQRNDREHPYIFKFDSPVETVRAHTIATMLLERAAAGSA